MSDLAEQIDALLALNAKGAVSHPIPGLAVELLERARDTLSALPPVDGLEVVGHVKPDHPEVVDPLFVRELSQPWMEGIFTVPVVTLSQASSVIAGLKDERDEARRGEYAANEHEPTWDELTSVWKARAETAEQEAKARLDALNQVGLTPEQKSWVDSFLKTRTFLSARRALGDHNG